MLLLLHLLFRTPQAQNPLEHLQNLDEVHVFTGDPVRIYFNFQTDLSCLGKRTSFLGRS